MGFRWIDDTHVEIIGNLGGYQGTYEATSAWVQDNQVHLILFNGVEHIIG